MEIWKDVVGFEGIYQISNEGRVKSVNRTIKGKSGSTRKIIGGFLKSFIDKSGYEQVVVCKDAATKHLYIHRLLSIQFLSNPNNLPEVNHKNGNKSDNRLENLEWCDDKQNTIHAYKLGLANGCVGSKNSQAVLNEATVKIIFESKGRHATIDLAKKYEVSRFCIESIFRGDSWNSVTGLPKRMRDENRRVITKGNYTYITRKQTNSRQKKVA